MSDEYTISFLKGKNKSQSKTEHMVSLLKKNLGNKNSRIEIFSKEKNEKEKKVLASIKNTSLKYHNTETTKQPDRKSQIQVKLEKKSIFKK